MLYLFSAATFFVLSAIALIYALPPRTGDPPAEKTPTTPPPERTQKTMGGPSPPILDTEPAPDEIPPLPSVMMPRQERQKVSNSLDGLADGFAKFGVQDPPPPEGWERDRAFAEASRVVELIEDECQCRTEGLSVDCRAFPCFLFGPERVDPTGMDWLLHQCIRGCATLDAHGIDPSRTEGVSIPGLRMDDGTMHTWSYALAPMSAGDAAHYDAVRTETGVDPSAYTLALAIQRAQRFFSEP